MNTLTAKLSPRSEEAVIIYKAARQLQQRIASFCDRWGDTSDSMHTLCNDLDNSAGDLISNTELFLGDNLMADGQ